MSTTTKLVLSDAAMSAVLTACRPLPPDTRHAFVAALVALLHSEPCQPPGDGAVARAIRSLQREFWSPPRVAGTVRRTGPVSDPGPAIE
jgi:hypothetical protein